MNPLIEQLINKAVEIKSKAIFTNEAEDIVDNANELLELINQLALEMSRG